MIQNDTLAHRLRTLAVAALAAAAAADACHAGFVEFQSEYSGDIGGRNVFQVYAIFDESDDVLLNLFNHQTVSGSQAGVMHNDFAGGSWNPNFTFLADQGANDSFVTMNGSFGANSSTNLDPSFGSGAGSDIPHNAGWYTSNPGTPITAGAAGTWKGANLAVRVMQVALSYGSTGWGANLTMGYKDSPSSTTPLWGYGYYEIPAPGAIALLGVGLGVTAPSTGRRRRAER